MSGVVEKVLTFGQERNLGGVLSLGAGGSAASLPAVLLLNSGLIHRVGPFRMAVEMARALATAGFDVLRYDQSGLGDSEARRDQRSYEQRAVEDAVEAMDHLRELRGHARFVLVGLCSGAVNAHAAAKLDPRVVGTVFIDGYAVETPQFKLRAVAKRALSPRRWQNLVSRGLSRIRGGGEERAVQPEADEREEIFQKVDPPAEVIAADLASFARRGVKMYFVYTSSTEPVYNGEGQLFEAFPHLRGVAEVGYYPLADHTFTLLAHRREMLERLVGWARRSWSTAR